ncbi:MAG: cytochrome C [Nocardiopsaceae bacterium]|nr:cytochrome C [Nocardiopsaceae bacterium]
MGEPPRRDDAGQARNEMDARIGGDVVQARDVSGGVHFHADHGDPPGPRVPLRQLPADVRLFVNRQPELRALTRLAGSTGAGPRARPATVVVIVGSAGVGKTALALHWAHRIRDRFPDGELYANLRGFDEGLPASAGAVLDRFLRDLGVPAETIPADLDERAALYRSLVAGRRILILLDNAADVGQVRPLIPGDSGPFVIITSRNQLGSLAVRDSAQHIRLDIFAESDAVALLRRVTRTGGRRDSQGDLAELAGLCARLPLALRIAAEHAVSRPTMRLAELVADLRDDSLLWDALSTGEGPGGEAVRTVFAWSYRDLSPEAARMFRALGLHPGQDVSLPAAAAAAGVSVRAARRALDILTGSFLVESVRSRRYQLHDLLRAYALDQARAIDSVEERRETIDRILRWYIVTALHACRVLFPGKAFEVDAPVVAEVESPSFDNSTVAFEWFDAERPNLVSNAQSAMESGLASRAWELAMVLSPIHANYFTFDDWSALSEIGVAAAEEITDPPALASALDNRGRFLLRRRALDDAKAAHSRALAIQQEIGDERGMLRSLNALGLASLKARDLPAATAYFTDTRDRAHSAGEPYWEGTARLNLATAFLESGRAAWAMEILTPLPRFFADQRSQVDEGAAHYLIAGAHRLLGDHAAALAAIDAALKIAEDAGNRMWEGHWLIEAARVHLALNDTGEAMRCCQMAASLQRQIGDPSREATALDCTGEVMLAMGNAEDASAFHREAARMHRQLGDEWQEALALAHLAGCEAALGRDGASREQAVRALALIDRFSDDLAERLKADLRASLR